MVYRCINFLDIQEIVNNPDSKAELINKLLKKDEEMQNKVKRRERSHEEREIKSARAYPGKEEPDNPEFETDFKKAFHKVCHFRQDI